MDLAFCAVSESALAEDCSPDELEIVEDVRPLDVLLAQAGCCNMVWATRVAPLDDGNTEKAWFGSQNMAAFSGTGSALQIPPWLIDAYSYDAKAYGGDEPSGASLESVGRLSFINCGGLDDLTCRSWRGTPVEIYAGPQCARNLEDMTLVFQGGAKALTWDTEQLTVQFGDRRQTLDVPINTQRYSGTGGLDGRAELTGVVKPLTYGLVFNISPVLVDANVRIYQVHDGGIQAITEVRDRGVALTYAGDVANILTAAVAPGTWVSNLASGTFRLGAEPDGQITADVQGETPFVATTVSIILRIIATRLGANAITSPTELNAFSFAQVDSIYPGQIGIYITRETTVAAVLDQLMAAAVGWWGFTREGKIALGLAWDVGASSDPNVCRTLDSSDLLSLTREPGGDPSYQRRVRYRPNWTQQDDGQLSPAVAPADRNYYESEGLFSEATDNTVQASNPAAQSNTTNSFLVFEADAQAFADALLARYSNQQDIYQASVHCGLLAFDLGDCIQLDLTRFKLDPTRQFQVIGVSERASEGSVLLRLAA